jgi:hypothetical protein
MSITGSCVKWDAFKETKKICISTDDLLIHFQFIFPNDPDYPDNIYGSRVSNSIKVYFKLNLREIYESLA